MHKLSVLFFLAGLALVLGAALAQGGLAVFTDTASVPSNNFTTAASFDTPTPTPTATPTPTNTPTPGASWLATGSYTGDGIDNRAITGIGFQPDAVIIKRGTSGEVAVMRTSSMTGDATKLLVGGNSLLTNRIQSLDSDGFTIGTNGAVNTSGVTYYWTAFKGVAGRLNISSYTGNGTSQSITGVGFSPEYVIVLGSNANNAVHRSSTMPSAFRFDENAAQADSLNSLDPDGFSVGSSAQVNASGVVYHYAAWNVVGGTVNVGSYTGDSVDNRSVTGVGFQPSYVIVKAAEDITPPVNNYPPVHRPASLGADSTLNFTTAANFANAIQALAPDGFQVGTDTTVNATGITYFWIAFGP